MLVHAEGCFCMAIVQLQFLYLFLNFNLYLYFVFNFHVYTTASCQAERGILGQLPYLYSLLFAFVIYTGVHKSFHPTIRDGSTWSKFGARGEHVDVLRLSTEVFSGSPT